MTLSESDSERRDLAALAALVLRDDMSPEQAWAELLRALYQSGIVCEGCREPFRPEDDGFTQQWDMERYEHDPVTGECDGLMHTRQGVNHLYHHRCAPREPRTTYHRFTAERL